MMFLTVFRPIFMGKELQMFELSGARCATAVVGGWLQWGLRYLSDTNMLCKSQLTVVGVEVSGAGIRQFIYL